MLAFDITIDLWVKSSNSFFFHGLIHPVAVEGEPGGNCLSHHPIGRPGRPPCAPWLTPISTQEGPSASRCCVETFLGVPGRGWDFQKKKCIRNPREPQKAANKVQFHMILHNFTCLSFWGLLHHPHKLRGKPFPGVILRAYVSWEDAKKDRRW